MEYKDIMKHFKDSIEKDRKCYFCGKETLLKTPARYGYEMYEPSHYKCLYCDAEFSLESTDEKRMKYCVKYYKYVEKEYEEYRGKANYYKNIINRARPEIARAIVAEEL